MGFFRNLPIRKGQSSWLLVAALPFYVIFFAGLAALASALTRVPPGRWVLPVVLLAAATWIGLLAIVLLQAGATGAKSRAKRFGAAVAAAIAVFIAAAIFSVSWVGGPSAAVSLKFGGPGIALALIVGYSLCYAIALRRGNGGPAQTAR